MTQPKQKTKWWLAAIIAPVILTGFGLLVALGMPRNESDWFGVAFIATAFGGLLLGCLLAILFTAISYLKNEEGTRYAFYILSDAQRPSQAPEPTPLKRNG